MKRSIFFWLYFIGAILLAIYFATRIIMTFMGYGPNSMVRNISISVDTKDKDLTALASAVGISAGTHTYSIDLDVVNARVGQTPGVKESAIRRLPNGNLKLKVKLYRAVATWTDGQYYYPLSADGTIVNQPSEERNAGAVVFRGNVPKDISEITKSAIGLLGDLDYMEWIDGHRWNAQTTNGITVMLPEDNPNAAIAGVITLNKKHRILSKNISVIDMRDPARILVK